MVVSSSSREETLLYNVKLSSVGPGHMTRPDLTHEPTNINLTMKLHYLRGVYYFKSHEAFEGMTIMYIKETMFKWLNQFYVVCGRFRRSESGRPYIKCNDCGVRLIEAQCAKTIDEWLEMIKHGNDDYLKKILIFSQPIGPQLAFSPNVFIQLTRFKCGGMSVGLSWAHVLGDAYFASEFINMWGKTMGGQDREAPPNLAQYRKIETSPSPKKLRKDPLSIKWVDPVGDNWIATSNNKMDTFSFHVSAKQLSQLQSNISGPKNSDRVPPFESLCAVIWHCVAKVKNGPEPKVVTIVKYDSCKKKKGIFNDNQVISIVKGEFSIIDSDLKELATLVMDNAVDEREKIEETLESENGLSDVIMYGANLTFVDMEEATFYDMKVKGQTPTHVSYSVDGVGDEGVILVLPTPKDGRGGRFVTITLPENELLDLKYELKKNDLWSIMV